MVSIEEELGNVGDFSQLLDYFYYIELLNDLLLALEVQVLVVLDVLEALLDAFGDLFAVQKSCEDVFDQVAIANVHQLPILESALKIIVIFVFFDIFVPDYFFLKGFSGCGCVDWLGISIGELVIIRAELKKIQPAY